MSALEATPSPGTRPRPWPLRPPWRTLAVAALLAGLVASAYALWEPGSRRSDGAHDRRQNGIWMQHGWLGDDGWFLRYRKEARKPEFRDRARIRASLERLAEHGLRDLYPHLCPAGPRGRVAPEDPAQTERFLDEAERLGQRVMPWIGGVYGRHVLPEDPAWRKAFVTSAVELLRRHPRLAGVHLNIEPWPSGQPALLLLLEELRSALPQGRLLSLSAYPPTTLLHPFRDVHWEAAYLSEVARRCDQLVFMLYDTALQWQKPYRWLVARWVPEIAAETGGTAFLLGLPAYDDAGVGYHVPEVENLENGLQGVHAGLEALERLPSAYQGVALYSDWEMDAEEWRILRRDFLRR